MTVLSPKCAGLVYVCPNCAAVLAADPNKDIYEGKYIYCPLCKEKFDACVYDGHYLVIGGKNK